MKHAIMVIGHGKSDILQQTIDHLDDDDIDFYIHWDKKDALPFLHSKCSKIKFDSYRRKVSWGTDSLVLVENSLMSLVNSSCTDYDYVHLISANDIPLMTKKYFKNFFIKDAYLSFSKDVTAEDRHRIQWYYPIRSLNVRTVIGYQIILKPIIFFNRLIGINRLKTNFHVEKGAQWFSLRSRLVSEVLKYPNLGSFLHSYLADEVYIQSILHRYKPLNFTEKIENPKMAARYIDWKRGTPYVFQLSDVQELKKLIDTDYAFVRKVTDTRLMSQLFGEF